MMEDTLNQSVDTLTGVGAERKKAFERLGVYTLRDLLYFFPRDYEDRSTFYAIDDIQEEKTVCVRAAVFSPVRKIYARSGMVMCQTTVSDDSGAMDIIWFNNPYVVNQLKTGQTYCFFGKVSRRLTGWQMQNPVFEREGVGRITGHIIPLYPLTQHLSQKQVMAAIEKVLPLSVEEYIPQELRRQYDLCEINYALQNIHKPQDFTIMEIARKRLAFEEMLFFQLCLSRMKQQAQKRETPPMSGEGLEEFTASLPFALTNAQKRAIEEIRNDLSGGRAMNRLLQGDVGCGKTVVAAAAIYITVKNGHQAALMAPTEILANQHYDSFCEMFAPYGITVERLIGSMTAAEKKSVVKRLSQGEIDVLIGTHALIQKTVQFADLALVITDEQHRFGVAQRAALSEKGEHAHALVMSATPIPRTLSLILYGDLDISVIDELPPGRRPVDTFAVDTSYRARIQKFIIKNICQGRQAYIVCPLVEESEKMDLENAEKLYTTLSTTVLKDYHVALLYGGMKQQQKDEVMAAFATGEVDVLVSTTVIEVGINVKNANIMVVENAERFGLSQLHQLRGRVGRGEYQSYCILIDSLQNEQSRARMKVLCDTNDGFKIAEEDLSLRGGGDVLGKRQSGQMAFRMVDIFSDMALLKRAQEAVQKIENGTIDLTEQERTLLDHRVAQTLKQDVSLN